MFTENTHLKPRAPEKNLQDPKEKLSQMMQRRWGHEGSCCTDSIIDLYKQSYENAESKINHKLKNKGQTVWRKQIKAEKSRLIQTGITWNSGIPANKDRIGNFIRSNRTLARAEARIPEVEKIIAPKI